MSTAFTLIGASAIAVVLIGYYAQRYGLPPPPPKIAGVDLGTTYSSIAIFQTATGLTTVMEDSLGKKSIPSVVGFLANGEIMVGTRAVEQQELNAANTIYDAKRFIGKQFTRDDPQFQLDKRRYPFRMELDGDGFVYFEVEQQGNIRKIRPEEVGSIILGYLARMASHHYGTNIAEVVVSVPAEFDQTQRNFTARAVEMTKKMGVRRIISEPTAAALAYGLHKKRGIEYIVVVDVGGGTMDVSVLWLNNAVFVTQAMAGNNRLGGQDFNEQIQRLLLRRIREQASRELKNPEDLQKLRLTVEEAKLNLTNSPETWIRLNFRSVGQFDYLLTRKEFENENAAIFERIVEPIEAALEDCGLRPEDVDEIVLVGGSTRMPKIRQIVGSFFGKAPNYGVSPELAVVIGVAIQAGVVVNGWPLQVAALEMPFARQKRHIYHHRATEEEKEASSGGMS